MNRTRSHYIHACSFSVSLRFAHLFRHFVYNEVGSVKANFSAHFF